MGASGLVFGRRPLCSWASVPGTTDRAMLRCCARWSCEAKRRIATRIHSPLRGERRLAPHVAGVAHYTTQPRSTYRRRRHPACPLLLDRDEEHHRGLRSNCGRRDLGVPQRQWVGQTRGFRMPAKYGADREHRKVSLGELFKLLTQENKNFTAATVAIIVASACSMVTPTIFGNVVDLLSGFAAQGGALEAEMLSDLYENAVAMMVVSVVGTGAMFSSTAILDIVGQKIGLDLRKKLFGNILQQDLEFFDRNQTGELANRLSTDVHEVAEHLVENVAQLLHAVVMGLGSAAMLVVISPKLSLVTLSVVPAMALGATKYSKVVKRLSEELLNALATSTQVAAERMSAIRIVRLFAAEDRERERYGHIIDDSMSLARRLAISEGTYVAAVYFISNFALVGVLFMGAGMVMDGSFTVGALASYCLYANQLSESVKDATDGVAGMIRAQGAAGRLYGLLMLKPQLVGGTLRPPRESIQGRVSFRAVTFAYPTRPQATILNGFNLDIEPGDNVGVTGPSGCGKSSLALLLTRLYAPTAGHVLLDGYDIATLDPVWLRGVVGVITQEPLLLSGTVRDNIAFGKPDATLEEIKEAATLANAHTFISHLPDGYDTEVGERALVLSGGQKQRLSIARALLLRYRVLILDEATSSLDAANEREILRKLLEVSAASTVITIGHSARQLQGSGRVVLLDKDGRVVKEEAVVPAHSE